MPSTSTSAKMTMATVGAGNGMVPRRAGRFSICPHPPVLTTSLKIPAQQRSMFSITINPTTCKGCMECVKVCEDDALRYHHPNRGFIATLGKNGEFWTDLPNTPANTTASTTWKKRSVLETILLNKDAYLNFASGDGACLNLLRKIGRPLIRGDGRIVDAAPLKTLPIWMS